MLNANIFREYDIRGIADGELQTPDVADLGRGLGTLIRRVAGKSVNVGRDCRLSSPRLHGALLEGLIDSGCEVTDVGVIPTPLLYFSLVHLNADGAVMITGSHNPAEFNGFKMVTRAGSVYGEQIQKVRRIIETRDFLAGRGSHFHYDVVSPYIEEVSRQFQFPRRIKVVADAGNGTAGPVLHRLFEQLNVEVTELFFEMDGRFPNHHPDPTVPENLEALRRAVRESKADLGLAFDGDADRIGAIDENGEAIYGDMLMLIYGREILSRKPGATFIGEVKCSQVMYDELKRLGGNPIMFKTGHSLIKAKMKQERAELAGEMSGHMFFADRYYGYDDAIYAAFRLLEIVARSDKPLSHQLEGIPRLFSTPELRVDSQDDLKFRLVSKVAEILGKRREIIDIDGVRIPFERGWGLIRASNTQPVIVMRFEAETEELLESYRKEIERAIEQAKTELGEEVSIAQ